MKFVIISILILFSLELTLEPELIYAQSLTSLNIHSIQPYHPRLAPRPIPSAPKHITGSGTSTNPYLLYDTQDVDSIRYLGLNNKYYELANDIDLSSITEFTPIPNDNTAGTFSLEGNGHTLYGLKQTIGLHSSSSGAYSLGMFSGKTSGKFKINNLVIDNFRINKTTVTNLTATYFSAALLVSIFSSTEIQLSKITIKNSSLRYFANPTTFPALSYMGLLVGRANATGVAGKVSYVSNCLVEYDTISYVSTFVPNSGHWIGGIAGILSNGSGVISFEYNASRYNYFYSRTGSTSRKNVGGGLLGSLSLPPITIRYNYSHSNIADFGSGGAPNNHPWGFGGIFGYTDVENVHTFIQNYAANNQSFGTNQSGGFFAQDNSTITAQVIDSTTNFCDITSFAEPNTVYGSVRYSASQYPSAKTSVQLKDINTFIGWDFINTWAVDSTKNNGYPYLQSEE